MATALYSNPPLADFILSEAHGQRSRDNGHVRQTGAAVKSGTVLQQDTAGQVVFAMNPEATGNPTIGSATAGALAVEGIYTIEFTSATAFKVIDPNGVEIGTGATGTAFNQQGLGFTLTAGSTAAVEGDKGTLNVIPADDSYVPYTTGGTAVAILYSDLKAATAVTEAVIFTRDCEVKATALTGLDAKAIDDLKAKGIVVRTDSNRLHIHTPAL